LIIERLVCIFNLKWTITTLRN